MIGIHQEIEYSFNLQKDLEGFCEKYDQNTTLLGLEWAIPVISPFLLQMELPTDVKWKKLEILHIWYCEEQGMVVAIILVFASFSRCCT